MFDGRARSRSPVLRGLPVDMYVVLVLSESYEFFSRNCVPVWLSFNAFRFESGGESVDGSNLLSQSEYGWKHKKPHVNFTLRSAFMTVRTEFVQLRRFL